MVVLIALGFSALMRVLKQPLIIGYILTGIVVGPYFLNAIQHQLSLEIFSYLGISFLLFIGGLSLKPKLIKSVGKIALATGIGQMVLTFTPAYFISKYYGFSTIASIYIGFAMAFSSTIIIVKLLSDKNNLESLHGRIAIGLLIIQDIAAIMVLMAVSSFSGDLTTIGITIDNILKGVGMLTIITLFSFFVLPKLHEKIAKSQEFLLLFAIGWLLLITYIFKYMGFSIEIGALIAGVMLASSPYSYEISSKMKILRNFFLLFFFVFLGTQMTFIHIQTYIVPIILFSLLVLIGIPVIISAIMGFFGYAKRIFFLTGISVAQISEFSFILVALGVTLGHVDATLLSMVTAVGLITFVGSAYMVEQSETLYKYLKKPLKIFERKGPKAKGSSLDHTDHSHDVIMFGCNRIGDSLRKSLVKLKKSFLIVDFNPDVINKLNEEGYHCKYGDANDLELLDSINFKDVEMVISTIPDVETNLLLLKYVRERNRDCVIIMVSHHIDEALKLHQYGATYVLMPYFLGAQYASTLIEQNGIDISNFVKHKIEQIKELNQRKEKDHKHPKREGDR